jgi:hypothetical protein
MNLLYGLGEIAATGGDIRGRCSTDLRTDHGQGRPDRLAT